MAPLTHSTWVIVGASRGIGAQFVEELLEGHPETTVFATARSPGKAAQLQALQTKHGNRLHIHMLDMTDVASVLAAAANIRKLSPGGIDYLINNAGVSEGPMKRTRDMSAAALQDVLLTNTLGPHTCTQAFLPQLIVGSKKTVVNISSLAGSSQFWQGQIRKPNPVFEGFAATMGGYKASKAALTNLTVMWAKDLSQEGFTFLAMHPGMVATDMAAETIGQLPEAKDYFITPKQSVEGMLKVIEAATPADNGNFVDYKGEEVPF